LATVGCHIDVRKERITSEVQVCYTMFCYMKEKVVSRNSSLLGEFPSSPKIDMEDILNWEGPPNFDWVSTKDSDQRYVKVKFAAPVSPGIPKVQVHASNESTMSDYCRFARALLSLPPIEGSDAEFDLGVKQGDSSQFDGLRKRFVLYNESVLWHKLMTMKDLQPELLRWYIRLKKFYFVVCDKANVHTLTDSDHTLS